MTKLTGLLLLLVLPLTACGGNGGSNGDGQDTAHFAATVRTAYSTAMTDSQHSSNPAPVWETFAVTVGATPAGKDATQRALLVSDARHASAAYQTRRDAALCTINGGKCPDANADHDPDPWLQKIAEIVRGL